VIENFLNRTMPKEEKVVVLAHHAAVTPETRETNLQRFLIPPEDSSQQRLILVCTDRASRGVDSAFVDHVVLFDFPRDPSEYLRRVGRTGRGASGRGVVTVLVLGRQVKLANDVIGRNQSGLPVHALPAVMPRAPSNK
jgi:ATP-dependent RNA helicase DDX18/HAS1